MNSFKNTQTCYYGAFGKAIILKTKMWFSSVPHIQGM